MNSGTVAGAGGPPDLSSHFDLEDALPFRVRCERLGLDALLGSCWRSDFDLQHLAVIYPHRSGFGKAYAGKLLRGRCSGWLTKPRLTGLLCMYRRPSHGRCAKRDERDFGWAVETHGQPDRSDSNVGVQGQRANAPQSLRIPSPMTGRKALPAAEIGSGRRGSDPKAAGQRP